MDDQPEITFNDFASLMISDNQLSNIDPVREAFKVYDPQETGFVDMEVTREVFQTLGYGEVSEEDIRIILETADTDRDGRIGLEDFRKMVTLCRRGNW